MDPLGNKYSVYRRLIHKLQARRDIPFRKKFFVGYDLHGNTYWEFTVDGNMQRLRRIMEPYKELLFKADYFRNVPPQWHQWLRRTRNSPPSLQELVNDQMRQTKMKILAQQADEKWAHEKAKLEQHQSSKLQGELEKVEKHKQQYEEHQHHQHHQQSGDHHTDNPWAEADKANKHDHNPIESANIKIRR